MQMILTRMIGLKEQMPGSGQWRLLTQASDECWHCNQWIYTLIFWDAETIAREAKKSTHHKVLNQLVKLVEGMNPELQDADHRSNISLSLYEDGDDSEFSEADSEDYQPRTIK